MYEDGYADDLADMLLHLEMGEDGYVDVTDFAPGEFGILYQSSAPQEAFTPHGCSVPLLR
jgi:hypothetical protein